MAYKDSTYIKHKITTTGSEIKILEYKNYKNYYSRFYINSIMFTNPTTGSASLDVYFTNEQLSTATRGDLVALKNGDRTRLNSTTVEYYILKDVVIPAGSSLVLEQDDIHLETPFDLAIVTTQRLDVSIEIIDQKDPIYTVAEKLSRRNTKKVNQKYTK
tara:strand:- start:316 stop:792 length:477 start_codon:yes stop_codon:yes gene_type:complete